MKREKSTKDAWHVNQFFCKLNMYTGDLSKIFVILVISCSSRDLTIGMHSYVYYVICRLNRTVYFKKTQATRHWNQYENCTNQNRQISIHSSNCVTTDTPTANAIILKMLDVKCWFEAVFVRYYCRCRVHWIELWNGNWLKRRKKTKKKWEKIEHVPEQQCQQMQITVHCVQCVLYYYLFIHSTNVA